MSRFVSGMKGLGCSHSYFRQTEPHSNCSLLSLDSNIPYIPYGSRLPRLDYDYWNSGSKLLSWNYSAYCWLFFNFFFWLFHVVSHTTWLLLFILDTPGFDTFWYSENIYQKSGWPFYPKNWMGVDGWIKERAHLIFSKIWGEKYFKISVDNNQLDVTFCILYFSSHNCSTCFGQTCAHHQELTTAWCYSLVLVCAVAAGRLSSPVGR